MKVKLTEVPFEVKAKGVRVNFVDKPSVSSNYIHELKAQIETLDRKIIKQFNDVSKKVEEAEQDIKKKFAAEMEEQVKIAFEDGRRKGIEEGKNLKEEELSETFDTLRNSLSEVQKEKSDMLRKAEEDVIRLAISISRKILQAEPHINKKVINKVIVSALDQVIDKSMVRIHINPNNVEMLEKEIPNILVKFKELPKIELVEDSLVGPGGCMIETRSGFIDARLETQLGKLSDKLFLNLKAS